jgi:CCR4-NOT transcription complex subunit 1
VESNGAEVYTKYIRRLVQTNQSTIFSSSNRPADGTYQALLDEVHKCNSDPHYAYKLAEALDTTEGDLFRDFDLSTFINHFDLNPLSKTSLALAFKNASKVDLRTKGDPPTQTSPVYLTNSRAPSSRSYSF